MNENKFAIVLFSGTVDKIMAATTMIAGAAAMGKEVTLFLTFGGIVAFRKDAWKTNMQFSKDFEEYAGVAAEMMQIKKVPHWMDVLRQAIDVGDVKVKACSMTMDLFDIRMEDMEPVVSEVTGVASFIQSTEGGTVLFI